MKSVGDVGWGEGSYTFSERKPLKLVLCFVSLLPGPATVLQTAGTFKPGLRAEGGPGDCLSLISSHCSSLTVGAVLSLSVFCLLGNCFNGYLQQGGT